MNAIIFDFDGTVADSFDQVLEFLCKEAHRDASALSEAERAALRGYSMRDLAIKVGVPRWKLPVVYFRGKSKLAKKMHVVQPFEGIKEMLASLHDADYQLYMLSSNSKRNIDRFLSEHGLGGYFIKVYGNAGWFGKGGVLKRTLVKHGLAADATVYVGDEVRDVVAAKIAGTPSVAVTWGFGSEEQLLKYGPTILVRQMKELEKTLLEWGSSV